MGKFFCLWFLLSDVINFFLLEVMAVCSDADMDLNIVICQYFTSDLLYLAFDVLLWHLLKEYFLHDITHFVWNPKIHALVRNGSTEQYFLKEFKFQSTHSKSFF